LKSWRKETTAPQKATEASLEKVKTNPEKKKAGRLAGLEEMEAAVDTLEEMFDKRTKRIWMPNCE
jgi:hypothetical protein